MTFTIAGELVELDAARVRRQVVGRSPEAIRTHWVEIDGVRWPPKQVFGLATGIPRTSFISHAAIRVLRRLGLTTSQLPKEITIRTAADVPRAGNEMHTGVPHSSNLD